ncbi:transposase (fragment) [Xanthomonas citri pv. citri]
MAQSAVTSGRTNIRHACQTFAVSETCFRYQAKASEENARIADWLVRLTTAHRDLGLWPVLPVPAQRERLWLEPQADLPDLPRVGVEPADQAEEAAGA